MQLDFNKGAPPLYYQIEELLKKKIENEEYVEGDILPSELELQEFFHVSRITVRQAINELVNEGYVKRTRGKGTTVIFNKIEEPLSRIMSFTEEMKMRGYEPSTRFVKVDIIKANKVIAKNLDINEGEEVYKIQRLRYADNFPMVFFITYLKKELDLPLDEKEYEGSLYEFLSKNKNIMAVKVKEYFEAVATDEIISRYLGVKIGTPTLKRTRLSFDSTGNNLEYSVCYYRAERYKYLVEIG
ncbi:GntR family transcriptional regulator [Haloimpatiens massiliensis]|uniref:GntR family transcriptional regulator n=1 Tax=Haloimpatiens massiliensis TaxID=1658110 RepID=UPI000C81AEDD|nr:GntR family transcriptional regulator [Haloimpatiens massiliensis]